MSREARNMINGINSTNQSHNNNVASSSSSSSGVSNLYSGFPTLLGSGNLGSSSASSSSTSTTANLHRLNSLMPSGTSSLSANLLVLGGTLSSASNGVRGNVPNQIAPGDTSVLKTTPIQIPISNTITNPFSNPNTAPVTGPMAKPPQVAYFVPPIKVKIPKQVQFNMKMKGPSRSRKPYDPLVQGTKAYNIKKAEATADVSSTTAATDLLPSKTPKVTAEVPMPPNWLKNIEDTIMSLLPFKKYNIHKDSTEYKTIANILHPIEVKGVEQIVNADLWDRFVKTRTDMFRSKTDDLKLLQKLGLNERDLMRSAHLSLNFEKDPLLIPYSDNMVLLFHCTRHKDNINSILSQGLDERLSNISGGLLGKGIYFADDPKKSICYDGTGYIFIFAVLLGDCISVDHFHNKNAFVREPEKVSQQKRNSNDQFFDSIVARPGNYNEYVIYNRYQCCPIYQIRYSRSSVYASASSSSYSSNFIFASKKLPPLAWIPSGPNYAMPIQDQSVSWPFFAVDIFSSMGVTPHTDDDEESNENPIPQTPIDDNLKKLTDMGYNDVAKNREILAKFNNDLEQTLNYFLDNETGGHVAAQSSEPLAVTSTSGNNLPSSSNAPNQQQSIVTIDLIDSDSDCSDDKNAVPINVTVTNNSMPSSRGTELPEDIAEWALEFDQKYAPQKWKIAQYVAMITNHTKHLHHLGSYSNAITNCAWLVIQTC